jgi:hypothetical protein
MRRDMFYKHTMQKIANELQESENNADTVIEINNHTDDGESGEGLNQQLGATKDIIPDQMHSPISVAREVEGSRDLEAGMPLPTGWDLSSLTTDGPII